MKSGKNFTEFLPLFYIRDILLRDNKLAEH